MSETTFRTGLDAGIGRIPIMDVQPVVDWLDNRGVVLGYGVRFTRPVVVDPETGATVTVVAKVGAVDENETRIDLTVTFADQTVLGKAQVRVSLT